jgi:hypothetical protein
MTIGKDLFLAILSMDSYNRGYGAGIADNGANDPDGLGEDQGISKIGGATVSLAMKDVSEDFAAEGENAGFYAVAYVVSGVEGIEDGTTVISYRGTDNADFLGTAEGASDAWRGWISGTGFPAGQSRLAFEFYEAVTGESAFDDGEAKVILTGHSLGGGLAGVVAAISDNEAVVVDNMPYQHLAVIYAMTHAAEVAGQSVAQMFGGGEPDDFVWPNASKIKSIYQDGEILQFVRDYLSEGFWEILSLVLGVGPALIDHYADQLSDQETVEELPNIWDTINPISLHSQQLKPFYLFAEDSAEGSWISVAPEAFQSWFDTALAEELIGEGKAANPAGSATADSKLRNAIAYSALDEGNLVFGDTGIRAMFDDLDALGHVYNTSFDGGRGALLDSAIERPGDEGPLQVRQAFSDIAVQYAGALALNKVRQDQQGHATSGVFELSQARDILALDLSTKLWEDTLGVDVDPIHESLFKKAFFGQIDDKTVQEIEQALDRLAVSVWGGGDRTIFDRFHMRTLESLNIVNMADRDYALSPQDMSDHVDVYVGHQDQENTVWGTSGSDLVFGGALDDVLYTRGGRDFIDGQEGDDTMFGANDNHQITRIAA